MPDHPPQTVMDPEYWTQRFDQLVALVKQNAEIARTLATDAATRAAVTVARENARSQEEIRRELLKAQAEDRKVQTDLHNKVDDLQGDLRDVLITLNKLSSANLFQLGVAALVLAALVIIGISVLGGFA